MSDGDKGFLAFLVFVALLIGGVASLILSIDTGSWTQTEDPKCVLRVVETKRLFTEDTTTRVRYCHE